MPLNTAAFLSSARVSVIVPVFRVEAFLRHCVDSLLAQTYGNVEILLVDDGSPDGSPAICDEYAANHSQIRVIHKENGGLSSARLAGFREARGEYILFIDSDDYVLPTMVEELVNAMEGQGADLAMCSYSTKLGNVVSEHQLLYTSDVLEEEAITQNYILPLFGVSRGELNIPGFLVLRMMKRKLIQESFFVSENTYYKEDHVFDLEYAVQVSRVAVVNKPLYVYCYNGASLSNRYRPGKWKMYENLYRYYQHYLSRIQLAEPKERMANMLAGSMFASIDNAVLSGNFATFRQEVAGLFRFDPAAGILSHPWCYGLPYSYLISFTLLRLGMLRLLYHFRRFFLC